MAGNLDLILLELHARDDDFVGRPLRVRTMRQDPPLGRAYLQEVISLDTQGNFTERLVYQPDGDLAYRQAWGYAADCTAWSITLFDNQGVIVQRKTVSRGPAERLERTMDKDGKEVERMISRLDAAGRAVETTITDSSGELCIHQTIRYEDHGGIADAVTTMRSSGRFLSELAVHIEPDRRTITVRRPDGTIDAVEAEGSRVEQIDARDSHGNWTSKSIFERRGEILSLAASLHRIISYE